MKPDLKLPALVAAALACGLLPPAYSRADDLKVAADTPEVTVSTRPPGRNFLRLPDLNYRFIVEASCRDSMSPAAMSLSVADTRVTIPVSVADSGPRHEISVTIPASQIGPVAVNEFCVAGDDASPAVAGMRIPAVLSAQAALTCASETQRQITYAAASLDVVLRCEQPADAVHAGN